MFEPKTFVEHRLALLESVTNQLLAMRVQSTPRQSPEYPMLEQLLGNWQFHGHMAKKNEALRVLGGPFPQTEDTATREWIDMIMRHNLGLLEVYGEGLFNPDEHLPGNNGERFTEWLSMLEQPGQVVRDSRPSEFFKDRMHVMQGLPVLKILAEDDQGRMFIHLVLLFQGLTMQSMSIDHLPANWDWDAQPDGWRVEVFTYLGNMSKRVFLREYAKAIKLCRGYLWGDEKPVLFVPEEDGQAIALAREITEELDMTYKAITAAYAAEPPADDDGSNQEPANDQASKGVLPAGEANTGDC